MDIKRFHLGKVAYVVDASNGRVERTMVGAIGENFYRFLNGSFSGRKHWFDFNHAVSAADECLRMREARLRTQLREISRQRKWIMSKAYETSVMSASYKVLDLRNVENPNRTRYLKRVRVPETHLNPGQCVYIIVTPVTRADRDNFRPHSYFILETKVRSVSFSPDGRVHFTYATPFEVEEHFNSREEAAAILADSSVPGVPDSIPFVSHDEERYELLKMLDDDIPF